MDTWATSSLTPQIVCGWPDDPTLFAGTFPMDLRPQAHDIIRTWLFDTVLRAELEHGSLPWKNAAISGWVLDPDRKKMSKSKGNVVTPKALLEEHGSDGARYWAAKGRTWRRYGVRHEPDAGWTTPGDQAAERIEVCFNAASAGSWLTTAPVQGEISFSVDRAILRQLAAIVDEATRDLESYDYTKALQRSEEFFWHFCDDYLELVKGRRYGEQTPEGAASANSALASCLSVLLRLFAPFLPFVTEEVWSWWQSGSIHKAAWPARADLTSLVADNAEATRLEDQAVYEWATEVLFEVRKQRSEAKQPIKVPITGVSIIADEASIRRMQTIDPDLRSALRVKRFDLQIGEPRSIRVVGYEPPVA